MSPEADDVSAHVAGMPDTVVVVRNDIPKHLGAGDGPATGTAKISIPFVVPAHLPSPLFVSLLPISWVPVITAGPKA